MKKEQYIIRGNSKCPAQLDAVINRLKTRELISKKNVDRFHYPSIKYLQSIFDSRDISSDEKMMEVIEIEERVADFRAQLYLEEGNDALFEKSMKVLETLEDIREYLSE